MAKIWIRIILLSAHSYCSMNIMWMLDPGDERSETPTQIQHPYNKYFYTQCETCKRTREPTKRKNFVRQHLAHFIECHSTEDLNLPWRWHSKLLFLPRRFPRCPYGEFLTSIAAPGLARRIPTWLKYKQFFRRTNVCFVHDLRFIC